jgi:Holliday junction DNA helicase RuvA
MISQLTGTVVGLGGNWAIVSVGGWGLKVWCSPQTAIGLRHDAQTTLQTSFIVREDAMTLYGFSDAGERDLFEILLSVSGVGPKLALAVVSVMTPPEVSTAVAAGDVKALTKVPGIGPKVAQRLLLELKDKVPAIAVATAAPAAAPPAWREQVRDGLMGLGWSQKEAENACDQVAEQADDSTATIAQLMRAALQRLAKK